MKYELNFRNNRGTDQELLDDLRRIANKLGKDSLTGRDYDDADKKFSSYTIATRFGKWNIALEQAGLKSVLERDVSEDELFKNLENVWIKLGKQPLYRDMKQPLSKFTPSPYNRKFGTWIKALEAFVEFINSVSEDKEEISDEENSIEITIKPEIIFKHKTKRNPSERLKVQVLMRDGNKCRLCGITVTGDNIHFDHILPWSKGGETTLENLQVLCAPHNLAKGNIE